MTVFTFADPMLKWSIADNKFILTAPLHTPEIIVPAGFITDGASVPQLLQCVVSQYDKHFPACIVHDFHYTYGLVSRERADELLGINLERLGICDALRIAMVAAVRTFGGDHYYNRPYTKK